MNSKTLRNFLILYLIILLAVIIMQIPQKDISADEPVYKVEIEDDVLKDAIIMNVNSPVILKGGEQSLIDSKDVDIVPKVIDDSTYVPVQFFRNVLNAAISWEPNKKETTVRYNNKAVIFTNKSKNVRVIDNDTDKIVEAVGEPVIVRERMYVPLRLPAEAFGKYVIYKEGLIVISNNSIAADDIAIENLLKKKTASLPIVGTEKNLEILLGKPDVHSYDERVYMAEINMVDAEEKYSNGANAENAVSDMAEYSSTNTQVEGVDEGDIVKTDGEYIYYIKDNDVVIVKAYPPEDMSVVSRVSLDKEERLSEIYINGNQLILLGNTSVERNLSVYEETSEETTDEFTEETTLNTYDELPIADNILEHNKRSKFSAAFTKIYDITDRAKPLFNREILSDGEYLSSRVNDSCIYVVSKTDADSLVCNGRYIPPVFYDSLDGKNSEVDFSDICYIPEKVTKEYLTVIGADLSDLSKNASVYTTIACGSDIYMSNDNLYVAANGKDTEIYKYKLQGGNASYFSHGKVDGVLHNSFSMDENNGYLRVTTTETNNSQKSNSLYVLDDRLDVCSSIENIAPEESIYSTRFVGNRAYMVTFETVDPLFVIDVKDPENPQILGSLKIPGYSDYLHPYDENHLIGIGKDTFVYEDTAYYKGIKLSMFDVSDIENPKEMFSEVIGDRGTESEVLNNHKALLFDKEKNILGFPVKIMKVSEENTDELNENDLQYGVFDFQGFLRYSIDMENGFVLESKTTHLTDEDIIKEGDYGGDESKYIKRGIYIGDYLYTLSDSAIKAEEIVPMTASHNKEAGFVSLTSN